ncbi:MAG: spore cortex biosynthesis protein YabQ [Thermoanaerobacterales bacterium]|nr:spore cortex biosynthesis protein YabQ [Thermoanaerobacterales bacterium]
MISLLDGQVGAFLWAIVIGAAAALFYDLYTAVWTGLRVPRWGVGVGDILFWAVLTVLVFALLIVGNAGDVRWYILLGMALGYAGYRRLLGARGYRFWRRLLRGGGRACRLAGRPFGMLYGGLAWPGRRIVRRLFRRRRAAPPPEDDSAGDV